MIVTLTAGVDPINFIPWGFALLSILVTIYTLVKRDTKEDTATTATIITKLEDIQKTVDKTSDMITSLQAEVKDHGVRLTRLETQIERLDDGR